MSDRSEVDNKKELATNMTTGEATDSFTRGEWIVHSHYGVGQIMDTRRKRISNQENTYFRVQMIDSADTTIWIPVDKMDNGQIRTVTARSKFQKAIEVLKRPPQKMTSNAISRKSRINQVMVDNIPTETARLIRDLRQRQRSNNSGINQTERQALRKLTKRFVQEWAVCKGMTVKQARARLNKQLANRRVKQQEGV